jgi:hypothetical protein
MKKEKNLQTAKTQALNIPVVIGSVMEQTVNGTTFKYEILQEQGEFRGEKFYQVRNIETEFRMVIKGSDLHCL